MRIAGFTTELNPIKVVQLSGFTAFQKLKHEWNELAQEWGFEHANFTFEWLSEVWRLLSKTDATARLIVLRFMINSKTVGFCPLTCQTVKIRKLLSSNKVCFLGHSTNDYSGMMVHPEFEKEIAELFFCGVLAGGDRPNWDILLLKNMSERYHRLAFWKQAAERSGLQLEIKDKTKNFYIPLADGYEHFNEKLSKNFKNDLRKCANRLQRFADGRQKVFEFKILESNDLTETTFQQFIGWQIDRMKDVGTKSTFENKNVRDLVFAYLKSPETRAFMMVLEVGDLPMAFCTALRNGKTLSLWFQGFDKSSRDFSPNKLIIDKLVQYAAEKKFDNCDLSRGDYEYKQRWTNQFYISIQMKGFNLKKTKWRLLKRLAKKLI